jgi:hypothetical protein
LLVWTRSWASLEWMRSCGGDAAAGAGGVTAACGRRLCRKLEAWWEIDDTCGREDRPGGNGG